MNIKEAKEQIKNAMTAYFTKNEFGEYMIPIEKQRPVFLMGPPGIGKTAVMEQIASELDVALVSYSMTHHTRQSALGLPFIEKKIYGGREYSVSEYTMSEIIASVYDMTEKTGHREGILFLDEINCVSETLAPAMLQFLQYKIFGKHRVPDGWIVVTAGNPPEYNNSVREFDIVTWDRLKRIDIEPDYGVWKEYALERGVHPAILTYLDVKRDCFYKIGSSVDGKTFVTARGWSDLSDMIRLYEKNGLEVGKALIAQYIQDPKISASFAMYYDLFRKYRSDYQVDKILDGKADDEIVTRAKNAAFDERLALIGLLTDAAVSLSKDIYVDEKALRRFTDACRRIHTELQKTSADAGKLIRNEICASDSEIANGKASSSLSSDDIRALHKASAMLGEMASLPEIASARGNAAFDMIKRYFEARKTDLGNAAQRASEKLDNIFTFCENAFGDGQEMLVLVTELTANSYCSSFIGRYGCEKYFRHNKNLLFYERNKEIIASADELDTDQNDIG